LAEEIIKKYGPFQKLVLNDPADQMLSVAKSRLKNFPDIHFTGNFAEDLEHPDNSFSKIICLNSFHYYVDQPVVLSHFKRMLKPGGTLWIQDWNRVGGFRIANKLIDWLSPENINTRTLDEMKKLLTDSGFTVTEDDFWRFRWWNFFFINCH
jgi:ubiquinone/menaquinone biosynthesis C-methylase UbiE